VEGKPTILCNIAVCSYKWGLCSISLGTVRVLETMEEGVGAFFVGVRGLLRKGEKHSSTMYSKCNYHVCLTAESLFEKIQEENKE